MTEPIHPSTVNGTPIHYDTSYDELCEYLKTPGPLAWASFRALSYLGTSVSLKKLIELSQSSDWRFRRSAVDAIAYHPQAEEAIKTVGEALSDSSEYVIRVACEVVAKLKFVALHDKVLHLLTSADPNIRECAAKALNEIWQMDDFDKVYSIYATEKIQKVRNAAAWTLRDHATNDNWLKLFEAWWQDSLVRHRKWSCELASTFGVNQVKKELEKLALDKDGHVRKAAIKALELSQT
jgi:HEAT repeat protein